MPAKKIAKLVAASALLIATGALIWIIQWGQKPVIVTPISVAPTITPPTRPYTIDSEYFLVKLPATMQLKPLGQSLPAGVLDRYVATTTDARQRIQLAVTVRPYPINGWDDVSDLSIRQNNIAAYAKIQPDWQPTDSQVYVSDQKEVALFWRDGTKYAAIVIDSSSVPAAELQIVMKEVVQSWSWKSVVQ